MEDAPKEFLDPIMDSLMRCRGSDSVTKSHITVDSCQVLLLACFNYPCGLHPLDLATVHLILSPACSVSRS
jgi:hypothetical protein